MRLRETDVITDLNHSERLRKIFVFASIKILMSDNKNMKLLLTYVPKRRLDFYTNPRHIRDSIQFQIVLNSSDKQFYIASINLTINKRLESRNSRTRRDHFLAKYSIHTYSARPVYKKNIRRSRRSKHESAGVDSAKRHEKLDTVINISMVIYVTPESFIT